MGTSLLVDELLTSTGLPYSTEVMVVLLPPKFKVSFMEMYDGTRDPLKYLETFRAHNTLHGFPRKIACKAFPLTLKEPARVWYWLL